MFFLFLYKLHVKLPNTPYAPDVNLFISVKALQDQIATYI